MKILALETSAKAVSAAVSEDGKILASGYQDTGLTHSRTLMPIVEHILKNTGLTMADIDAMRSQIYNALFEAKDGALTRLTPDRAIALADLAEELQNDPRPKTVVGDGAKLCHTFLTDAGIPCRIAPPHLVMQNAMSVALEAEAMAAEDKLVSSQALEPVYLRPALADLLRKK